MIFITGPKHFHTVLFTLRRNFVKGISVKFLIAGAAQVVCMSLFSSELWLRMKCTLIK